MSPYNYNGGAVVFRVDSDGSLNNYGVNITRGVRPVINLKADVSFTGEGTVDSPYEIEGLV